MKVYVVEELLDHEPGYVLDVFASKESAIDWIRREYPKATHAGEDYWQVKYRRLDGTWYHGNAFQIHEREVIGA